MMMSGIVTKTEGPLSTIYESVLTICGNRSDSYHHLKGLNSRIINVSKCQLRKNRRGIFEKAQAHNLVLSTMRGLVEGKASEA